KEITLRQYSIDTTPSEFQKTVNQYGKAIPTSAFESEAWIRTGALGLLVLYRQEGKESPEFIDYMSMLSFPPMRGPDQEDGRYIFRGENRLMQAITKLVEEKPLKVGIARGNGELDFEDRSADPRNPAAGELKSKLKTKGFFDFKDVTFGPDGAKGLEDVEVLIMARPTEGLSPKAATALRDYLNPTGTSKKGKLVLMLDTKAKNSSLDAVVAPMNVKVEEAGILTNSNQPEEVKVLPDPRSSNPVARAFWEERVQFTLQAPRPVKPGEGREGGLLVETLLVTP